MKLRKLNIVIITTASIAFLSMLVFWMFSSGDFFVVLVGLGFEHKASHLQSRWSQRRSSTA
jgi:hypothetical protein